MRDNLPSLLSSPTQDKRVGVSKAPLLAKQIWRQIHVRGASTFDAMTDIPLGVRTCLSQTARLRGAKVETTLKSKDGTIKWLMSLAGGGMVECVYIPSPKRGTLCISSQVGCALTCSFCHTGTQAFVRNLSAEEIISQVLLARDVLKDWPPAKGAMEEKHITNIVFMGQGEPLYNFKEVAKACALLHEGDGLGFSKRRITVSTAGVVPAIESLGLETQTSLAVSLHAVFDEKRTALIPLNRKYPLKVLRQALFAYTALDHTRPITLEYVMLKGVNDTHEDAQGLVRFTKDLSCKVNLIPFNPWEGAGYTSSSPSRTRTFCDMLHAHHVRATIRETRGQDIMAACGQLKTASLRPPKQRAS